MKQLSNADFYSVLRLLDALSLARGSTVKERENARKAALLAKKLKRKDEQTRLHKSLPLDRGMEVVQVSGDA